ncbi:hypothetical protein [Aequoribacter sp.]|uniref:hypothetical protein n=1 Tax=Aequoribacter sp. TaxID=2847771 RepID=UPI003F69F3B7
MTEFDVYFDGQCLPGFEQQEVRENLQELFKANNAILDLLFSGKEQKVKGGLNEAGAKRYASALRKAGAKPLVRKRAIAQSSRTSSDPRTFQRPTNSGVFDLSPPGSLILRPEERPKVAAIRVNTEHLNALEPGVYNAPPEPQTGEVPNTNHLRISNNSEPMGRVILPAKRFNLSAYQLAEEGHDLSEFARPSLPTVEPMLELDLAPMTE